MLKLLFKMSDSIQTENKQEEDIDDFLNQALLWESEEFDISLNNGWITPELIPDSLANTDFAELRNEDKFLNKKTLNNRAILSLRNPNNEIVSQKVIKLVEVTNV